ncbi:MAG: cob(I)yrinic acid a,c-diamide adenosyltransferase [bacterium]
MKIYTKIGDNGYTKLYSGEKVPKNDPLVKAYGKIDTLISFLGFSKALIKSFIKSLKKYKIDHQICEIIENIQLICFKLMTDLAGTNLENIERINESDIQKIEEQIDKLWEEIKDLRNFVVPGNDIYSSSLHMARTTCREIEPLLVQAKQKYPINPLVLPMVNRISDLIFCLAVYLEKKINQNLTVIKNNKKIVKEEYKK